MLLRKLPLVFILLYNFQSVHVSCEDGISLAFAIDDTYSMTDIIEAVKAEASRILDIALAKKGNEVKDFVLVSINDPMREVKLRAKNSSKSEFLYHLKHMKAHNDGSNPDCPELSMAGIYKALINSRLGSYLFVFTDALAKDYGDVNKVIKLAQNKQIQVIFILTGDCHFLRNRRWYKSVQYQVYNDIAKATSGQVFRLKIKEVKEILAVIGDLLHDQKSVILSKELQFSFQETSFQDLAFNVDEKTEFVSVSSNGNIIDFEIFGPNGYRPQIERVGWSPNVKVVKMVHPVPGPYYTRIHATGTVSVVVYVTTDFTFEHGFSAEESKSLEYMPKLPTNRGTPQHLYINVTDIENAVDIQYVQLIDMDGNEIGKKLILNKIGKNFYRTPSFVSPISTYNIKVVGQVKKSKTQISRFSKTPVQPPPRIPNEKPKVHIKEGKQVKVYYDDGTTLTCTVTASPEPTITWTTSKGDLLPSQNSEVDAPEYVSYLKLNNLKKSETYTCRANNNLGSSYTSTEINVQPLFRTISSPAVTTSVKYGEVVKIRCDIKSDYQMKINWYKSGKEISNNNLYYISTDRTVLTIQSLDHTLQGNYTCEGFLTSNPNKRITYNTDVKIAGLAQPVIETSEKTVLTMKGNKFELKCKVIKGYPQPRILWYKKQGDNFKQISGEAKDVMMVEKAVLSDAGQYKCMAQNVLGTTSAVFDVTVKSRPEVRVKDAQRTFSYSSDVGFTCYVESYVRPIIQWIDERGTVLESLINQDSAYDFNSRLKLNKVKKSSKFTCIARNEIGVSKADVDMKVTSPFEVIQRPEINKMGIRYGEKGNILCNIRSTHSMKISWYKQNTGASRTAVVPSDKLSISSDGTKLNIKSMDLDLNGKYICEASLVSDPEEKISFNADIEVIGLVVPQVIDSNAIVKDKKLTAICRVKAVPKPVISWQFKPKGSKEFHTIPGSEEELNIPQIMLKHTGIYKCLVKNFLGQDNHEFNIVVKEEPKIITKVKKYFALKGDRVLRIPCNVTGFPDPIISWRKDGKTIKKDIKYDVKENSLYITNVIETDTANYTCEAVNEVGTAQETFEANVTVGFKTNHILQGNVHPIYAIKGTPVTMTCNLSNPDKLPVRWYWKGDPTSHKGISYHIANATLKDSGLYTCRVDTNEGSTSESFDLSVGFAPFFVYLEYSPNVQWNGKYENMNCEVESAPDAEVRWLLNGEELLMTSNYTQEYGIRNFGEYKCIASNFFGSVNRTFMIESEDCYINEHMTTENMPLWFYEDSTTWPFSSAGITLGTNKSIELACKSNDAPNTFLEFPNKNQVTAQCYKEDMFKVDGKIYKFSKLQCKTKVEPLIVNTHVECSGPHTEMIQIGFTVDSFLETYKICYDRKNKVPVFGSTPIMIDDLPIDKQTLFQWSQGPTGYGNPTKGDTCTNNTDCCYMKSQMVTVDEVSFGPAQAATLKDNLNSVAVWIPCERDSKVSWLSFEGKFKEWCSNNAQIKSWTGASDFTNENNGRVPQYIWKVIKKDEVTGVVVYINKKESKQEDIRCSALCNTFDEIESELNDSNLFYCCTLDEFSKAFGIPKNNF